MIIQGRSMENNDNQKTRFGFIGIILRFPIFIIISCLKIFISAPFEIIVKFFMLFFFVIVSILKYKYAVTYKNERLYREWKDEWDEGIANRKAIYRAFPQAVPITYLIEKHGIHETDLMEPTHSGSR